MDKDFVKQCCWGLCESDSRYPERMPEGTFFLPFPKPGGIRSACNAVSALEREAAMLKTEKAERWQYLCGRTDFMSLEQIWDSTYICSLHFVGGNGPTSDRDEPLLCEPLVARKPRDRPTTSSMEIPHVTSNASSSTDKRCKKRTSDEQTDTTGKQKLSTLISGKGFDFDDFQEQHIQLLKAYTEMQGAAEKLRAENKILEDALHSDFSKLSYRFLKCDNEQLLYLTGLHRVTFDWLVPQVAQTIFRVHPEVTPQDHLLMVLMKLKLGLCDDDLGYRFQVDGGIITPMIQTWIPALAAVLSPLIAWPSGNIIAKTKPIGFNKGLNRCRCIIDTLDVSVTTANETVKVVSYLIGATPAGAISFVSPGFMCKKNTDKQLIKESGFIDLLEPSDLLLSTKTFPIHKELSEINVGLLTPDGDTGKKPPVSKKREFSLDVWSHVDRVMDWWKDFSIFQMPISAAYEEMLDDVVLICAALTNVKISLLPNVKKAKKPKT